ncbi:TIGR04283 family arsenosugar biosynthesis glycosyltransferase [Kaarinaea lacus]
MPSPALSLSIIIPALNEADSLPKLLQDLCAQEDIQFETIVVDGGSTDNTGALCEDFPDKNRIGLKVLSSPMGRAIQMNQGAKSAASSDYLFLHADTRIHNAKLLSRAQQSICNARLESPNHRIAGHFPLRFTSSAAGNHYYFYECKTYLNRRDTINGDQGLWIARDYFAQLGGFDESLPYMEDARLALKIFDTGKWITLPDEIETSARRFEAEGFKERQILNSFLCNFNAMRVDEFFTSAIDVYRTQSAATRLSLKPFLKLAHQQMNGDGFIIALKRWYQTGAYIAHNSWQLAFALDCRRAKRQGLAPEAIDARSLAFYDRHVAHITHWPIIKFITAIFTVIWFYCLFLTR